MRHLQLGGSYAGWVTGWPVAVNQCADVAALPYRNTHVYTCVCVCVYTYMYNLIFTQCRSYVCVDICLHATHLEGVVPH